MIKFGISENYVPNWGVVQAIREIYQNFIDYGEFQVETEPIANGNLRVSLINGFIPESWEFLKIGFSRKGDGAIGKHGEGLKLAGLVFNRAGYDFRVSTLLGSAVPEFYEDEFLGKCYGLKIDKVLTTSNFIVSFTCNEEDIKVFNVERIKEEDIKHKSVYGNIVNRPDGNIYVGGLYVCNISKLKYALDFKPNFIELGRDREIPSTWDIEYYANQIVNSCSNKLQIKASDIYNREFNCGSFPDKLASKFTPKLTENGDLYMVSGKTIVTDKEKIGKLKSNPIVAKKVEKIRYQALFKSRKSPTTMLIDLRNQIYLSSNDKIKFDSIIKISRGWKTK